MALQDEGIDEDGLFGAPLYSLCIVYLMFSLTFLYRMGKAMLGQQGILRIGIYTVLLLLCVSRFCLVGMFLMFEFVDLQMSFKYLGVIMSMSLPVLVSLHAMASVSWRALAHKRWLFPDPFLGPTMRVLWGSVLATVACFVACFGALIFLENDSTVQFYTVRACGGLGLFMGCLATIIVSSALDNPDCLINQDHMTIFSSAAVSLGLIIMAGFMAWGVFEPLSYPRHFDMVNGFFLCAELMAIAGIAFLYWEYDRGWYEKREDGFFEGPEGQIPVRRIKQKRRRMIPPPKQRMVPGDVEIGVSSALLEEKSSGVESEGNVGPVEPWNVDSAVAFGVNSTLSSFKHTSTHPLLNPDLPTEWGGGGVGIITPVIAAPDFPSSSPHSLIETKTPASSLNGPVTDPLPVPNATTLHPDPHAEIITVPLFSDEAPVLPLSAFASQLMRNEQQQPASEPPRIEAPRMTQPAVVEDGSDEETKSHEDSDSGSGSDRANAVEPLSAGISTSVALGESAGDVAMSATSSHISAAHAFPAHTTQPSPVQETTATGNSLFHMYFDQGSSDESSDPYASLAGSDGLGQNELLFSFARPFVPDLSRHKSHPSGDGFRSPMAARKPQWRSPHPLLNETARTPGTGRSLYFPTPSAPSTDTPAPSAFAGTPSADPRQPQPPPPSAVLVSPRGLRSFDFTNSAPTPDKTPLVMDGIHFEEIEYESVEPLVSSSPRGAGLASHALQSDGMMSEREVHAQQHGTAPPIFSPVTVYSFTDAGTARDSVEDQLGFRSPAPKRGVA